MLHKSLVKQGLEFHLETKVTGATVEGDRVTVRARRRTGPRRPSRATGCWSPSAAGRTPRDLASTRPA